MQYKFFQANLLLWLITAIWGSTFWVLQQTLVEISANWLMTLRFAIATVVLLPFALRASFSRAVFVQGACLGLIAGLGFTLQTLSLTDTTVPRAAFATALSTILVPIASLCWYRRLDLVKILATALAALGLYSLFGVDMSEPFRWGDVIALLSAVAFAGQIMLVSSLDPSPKSLLPLMALQTGAATLVGVSALYLQGQVGEFQSIPWASLPWRELTYLGVVATSFCLLGQAWSQRHLSSSQAAFVFALEPIFASVFAWLMDGTAMSWAEMIGGALIVLANIVAEWPLRRRQTQRVDGLPST